MWKLAAGVPDQGISHRTGGMGKTKEALRVGRSEGLNSEAGVPVGKDSGLGATGVTYVLH
jgi:hypothetical protein